MSKRVYSEIYFHLNWHTKNSLPLIRPEFERALYQYLEHKVLGTRGALCHAIGGIEDHVHLAVTLPPTVAPAEWIGKLKGASSHHINQLEGPKQLEWHGGYGIISFGAKDLEWVVEYVLNQKEHHRTGRIYDRLERAEEEEDG
ncbi:MAG: transposase [Pyrinomonadaceae bacterium]